MDFLTSMRRRINKMSQMEMILPFLLGAANTTMSVTAGFPSVKVPVLSKITVSILQIKRKIKVTMGIRDKAYKLVLHRSVHKSNCRKDRRDQIDQHKNTKE